LQQEALHTCNTEEAIFNMKVHLKYRMEAQEFLFAAVELAARVESLDKE